MQDWSEEFRLCRYDPRDVAKLTGVDVDRQRLLSKRYGFDFRQLESGEGVRPRWRWTGVQQLKAFASVLDDLGSGELACKIVGIGDEQRYKAVWQVFEFDHRQPSDGRDIHVGIEFGRDPSFGSDILSGGFTLDSLSGLAQFSDAARAGAVYMFNVSLMQRKLAPPTDAQ